MSSNRLKLNGDKTQFIWLGTRQQLAKVDRSLTVGGVQIAPLDMVRNLGVLLDDELTMASHVNSVVRGCFFQLRQLQSVQRSLSRDAKKVIVLTFVASKIDYCNSLLYGTTEHVLHPMQVVLNAAARLVVSAGCLEHITPILRELHWLPIRQRILYKMAVLAFHCSHQSAPTYLSEMFTSMADVPEVRTPQRGRCTTNFHEAIWASQLPLSWPNSLEQFAV